LYISCLVAITTVIDFKKGLYNENVLSTSHDVTDVQYELVENLPMYDLIAT
ncbi:hypothetical protein L9F63_018231, partial [Diploptera punctata]